MNQYYFESIAKIGRIHKIFLASIRTELTKRKIRNVDPLQCIVIYSIGNSCVSYEELYNRYPFFVSVHYLDYVLRKLKKKEYVIEKRYEGRRKAQKNYVLSQSGGNFLVKVSQIFDEIMDKIDKSGLSKTEFEKLLESSLKLQQVCKDIIHSTKPKKTRINSNGLDTIN